LIVLVGAPFTYRRMLLRRNASVESAFSGSLCTKLVCIPPPTVTGRGASCADSVRTAENANKEHSIARVVHLVAIAEPLPRLVLSTVDPFRGARSARQNCRVAVVTTLGGTARRVAPLPPVQWATFVGGELLSSNRRSVEDARRGHTS